MNKETKVSKERDDNMTNKKKVFRIASLLLVLCMISTVMISGTFAKYTSEYSGQDTALVARWNFTGDFDNKALTGTSLELPIWDHDYVTNIYENTAVDKTGNYLIAPGISGSFDVEFSYDADVTADLTFNFTKTGTASKKVPIQYSLDGFTNIYYSLDDLEDAIVAGAVSSGGDGTYIIADTAASTGGTATNEAVGTGNGTSKVFNLLQTPTTGTLTVKVDGTETTEYTLLGNTITFASAPADKKAITASYDYDHTAINISKTVSWRWPYDITQHNTPAAILARNAAVTNLELVSAGTGDGNTWTDTDDTALGRASGNDASSYQRDDYMLTLQIKAVQKAPTTNP